MALKETIIIELDFDTSDFTNDAAKLNKEIALLNQEQKNLKKSGEEGSIQFQKNSEALRSNKKELAETNKTIQDLTNANKSSAGSNEQLRATLSLLTKEYNGLSKSERETGARGLELKNQINQTTSTLKANESAVGDNRREVGNYGKAWGGLGSILKKGIGLLGISSAIGLVGGAITGAIKTIKEFDSAIASLSAITGATGTDLTKLKGIVLQTAKDTKQGAGDVAKAFELVASAKPELLENADALASVTKQAIILSKASGLDLTDAVAATTTGLAQFGLEANRANEVIDALAAGAKFGASAIPETTAAIEKFGAVAEGSNVTLQESVALVETLATKQLKGAEAGNNLKNVILKLQNSGVGFVNGQFDINAALEETKKKFENIDDPVKRSAAETKLFGLQSVTAGKILLDNIDTFQDFTTKVSETGGALAQAEIRSATFEEKQKELGNTYDNLIISLEQGSGVFSKIFTAGVDALDQYLGGLQKLNDFDFDKIFNPESAEQQNKGLQDLSDTFLTLGGNLGVAAKNEEIYEQKTKILTEAVQKLSDEQLKSKEGATQVINNFRALGLSVDEAVAKYKELSGVQSQAEINAGELAKAEAVALVDEQAKASAIVENEKKRAEGAKLALKAAQDEITKSKELLDLFLAQQGLRAKSLEDELKIAEQVRDKELEILQKQLDAKLISQREFETESLNIKNEFLLLQSELVVDNAQRELDIITETNTQKLDANKFLTDEIVLQEQEKNNAILEANLEFEATRLEQGIISEQEYQDAIKVVKDEAALIDETLALEKAEADAEKQIIDLENQREIDELNRLDEFELRQQDLDNQKAQELLSAETTGADKKLIEEKFSKFSKALEKEQRKAQVGEALAAFDAIAGLAAGNAEAAKAIAIAQSIINGFQGVTAVLAAQSTIPEPFGSVVKGITAAAIGATALINVNKIRSTPVPKATAAKGGIFGGKLHSEGGNTGYFQDGTVVEVERGELFAVVNRNSTGMLNGLSNLNEAGGGVSFGRGGTKSFLQDGGVAINNVSSQIDSEIEQSLQIVSAVESLPPPVVIVQDINEVQGATVAVEQRAII